MTTIVFDYYLSRATSRHPDDETEVMLKAIVAGRRALGLTDATPLQIGVFVLSAINTAWSLAGLIANPDFATGDAATSVQVLGVDFNGWHALAGLVAFAPGLIIARNDSLSRLYVAALIPIGFVIPGIWALFDTRPMGLWPFEHNEADAALHLGNAVVYAALLAATDRARRRARWGPA